MLSNWRGKASGCRKAGKVYHMDVLRYAFASSPARHLLWNIEVIRWYIEIFQPRIIIFHSCVLPYRAYYGELFKDVGDRAVYLYKTDHFPVPHFDTLSGVVYLSKNLRLPLLHRMQMPQEKLIYIPIAFRAPRLPGGHVKPPDFTFKYILFVGSVYPLKGVFDLLKAFRRVKEKFPGLRLVIAGPGGDGVCFDESVIFTKELGRDRVCHLIRNAELVVIPSYSEGLPRVGLETLWLKKPLLITGGVAETRHLPPVQVLERNCVEEITGKIISILSGAHISTQFPWKDLRLKKVKQQWLKLLEAIPQQEQIESPVDFHRVSTLWKSFCSAGSRVDETIDNPFVEMAAQVEVSARDLPGLPDFVYLKDLSTTNYKERVSSLVRHPWLMNSEKKKLLKPLLLMLSRKLHIHLEPGEIKIWYHGLVPLVADDFLFLGQLMLEQKKYGIAGEYLLQGLKDYPEHTRLKIYRTLFSQHDALLPDPGERKRLEADFTRWIRKIEPEQLVLLVDESFIEFLDKYLEVNQLLSGIIEKYKNDVGGKYTDFCFKAFFLRAALRKNNGEPGGEKDYNEAAALLRNKRPKTSMDNYRLASLEQQLGRTGRAKKGFLKVLKRFAAPGLRSGAFFHLGRMAMDSGSYSRAGDYFEKCLDINPDNRAAAEYLKQATNLMDKE